MSRKVYERYFGGVIFKIKTPVPMLKMFFGAFFKRKRNVVIGITS